MTKQPLKTETYGTYENPVRKSHLAVYQRCPRQFWLQYIVGMPSPPAPAMIRGTLFHAVVAVINGSVPKVAILPDVSPVIEKALAAMDIEARSGVTPSMISESRIIANRFNAYHFANYESTSQYLPEQELGPTRICHIRDTGTQIYAAGRADLIELLNADAVYVTDYKSGTIPIGNHRRMAAEMMIYRLLTARQYGVAVSRVVCGYHRLAAHLPQKPYRGRKPEGRVVSVLVDFSDNAVNHVLQQVESMVLAVRRNDFPAHTAKFDAPCHQCPFASICDNPPETADPIPYYPS